MIRPTTAEDTAALVALAESTGLFAPGEADALLRSTLDELHAGRLGDGHFASLWQAAPGAPPRGWVYFASSPRQGAVWDLWWIGVDPSHQGRGVGRELLAYVEERVRDGGGRLLLIETSALPALARTRDFYQRAGYHHCGVIPDYYGDGDGKVTFARRLAGRGSGEAAGAGAGDAIHQDR